MNRGKSMYLIETNELTKRYGDVNVVDHVNMHIPEGSIYGFVGENGSGKTTIMRLLTGLAEPTSGTYSLFGVSNKNKEIYKKRANVSAIVETVSLVPSMTAIDNIIYQEKYLGIKLTKKQREELLAKVHLEKVEGKKVRNFSLGMRQRLGIALALINNPKILLLDEPMNGLDPEGIAELRELLIELSSKEGLTILISSHILSELEKIANVYGFISHGKLLEEISAEDLQNKGRKSIIIRVNDSSKIEDVFIKMKIKDYKIYPNGDIQIFDLIPISKLVLGLDKAKIEVISLNSIDESVEDYYLNLMKGGN